MSLNAARILACCVFLLVPCGSYADESKSFELDASANELSEFEKEFRSIVVEKALSKKTDPLLSILNTALQFDFKDTRFDDLAEQLTEQLESGNPDKELAYRVVRGMPLTSIAPKQQAILLFDCYGRFSSSQNILQSVSRQFQTRELPFKEILLERLENPETASAVLPLFRLVAKEDQTRFLPALISLAKNSDSDLSRRAIEETRRVLIQQRQELNEKSLANQSVDGASEKSIGYAKRIVSRHDRDSDGVLSKAEWSQMLSSPGESDANSDGEITVLEYAKWMQSRQKAGR